jgi:transcriptional regulator with XRE-family HTH domain
VNARQLIGKNIRGLRGAAGWSQRELGKRLEPYVGRWEKQQIYLAEQGERVFDPSELVAFALAFQVPLWRLIAPRNEDTVELTGGRKISADQLREALFGSSGVPPSGVDELRAGLDGLDRIVDDLDDLRSSLVASIDAARAAMAKGKQKGAARRGSAASRR